MAITPYTVKVSLPAAKAIKDLPQKYRKLIMQVIETLGINPRPTGARKIEGMHGLYCETVHPYRLIYKIEDQEILVLLLK